MVNLQEPSPAIIGVSRLQSDKPERSASKGDREL